MSGQRLNQLPPGSLNTIPYISAGNLMVVCAQALRTSPIFSSSLVPYRNSIFAYRRIIMQPTPNYAQTESGRGWYLFSSYRQIISGPKMSNTRLEVRTAERRLPRDCAVLLNGGKESLVPLLCNCVLCNTDRNGRQFLSTSCVLTQAECPVLSDALLVPAYCPVLAHMQY
jgi:hypothetical protein